LRNDNTSFQQDRSKLVDQSSPFTNQPIACSVERLHIELFIMSKNSVRAI
jgi:hypothetical protein